MTLADLAVGNTATIKHIEFEKSFCSRCFAMGVRLGAVVTVIRKSPFNGPIQIRIGCTDLSLRKNLAKHIKVL